MLLPDPLLIYTVSPTGSTKDIPGPVTFTPCYERNSITLSYSPLGRDGRPSSLICNSFELGPQRIIKAKRTLLHQADVVISFPDSPLIIRARMPTEYEQAIWVSTLSTCYTRECMHWDPSH